MPFVQVINMGLNAAQVRGVIGSISWGKMEAELMEQDGEIIDINPHEQDIVSIFNSVAKRSEKDQLLALKEKGIIKSKIKSSRSRYGDPKEYDHFVLHFEREESAALTDEEKAKYKRILLKQFSKNLKSSQGKRLVMVADGHDDTGKFHIHAIVHRFAVVMNEEKHIIWSDTSLDLGRRSEADIQAKLLADAMVKANIPPIDNWLQLGGQSLYADRTVSDEAKEDVSKLIKEAGGQPSLDVQPSQTPVVAKKEFKERAAIEPQEEMLEKFVKNYEREASRLAHQSKLAAENVALGQHALEALKQKRQAEVKLKKFEDEFEEFKEAAQNIIQGHEAQAAQDQNIKGELIDDLDATFNNVNSIDTILSSHIGAEPGALPIEQIANQIDKSFNQSEIMLQQVFDKISPEIAREFAEKPLSAKVANAGTLLQKYFTKASTLSKALQENIQSLKEISDKYDELTTKHEAAEEKIFKLTALSESQSKKIDFLKEGYDVMRTAHAEETKKTSNLLNKVDSLEVTLKQSSESFQRINSLFEKQQDVVEQQHTALNSLQESLKAANEQLAAKTQEAKQLKMQALAPTNQAEQPSSQSEETGGTGDTPSSEKQALVDEIDPDDKKALDDAMDEEFNLDDFTPKK